MAKQVGESERPDGIKSLGKALDILAYVAQSPEGAGVSMISDELGINKATVSKVLTTMAKRRFTRKDPQTHRYRLGYRLVELGLNLIESIDLRAAASPHLKRLEKAINEVINLAIYHNGEVIYVDKLEGKKSLRLHSRVGGRASLTCTAAGKVMMAFLPEPEQNYLKEANPLERRTPKSIQTWEDFEAQCRDIRQQGYALDLEENEEGIVCVGAPIFDYSKRVIGAASVSCPRARCDSQRLMELKDRLVEVCTRISAECGYYAADE